jgi:hypothetical protein
VGNTESIRALIIASVSILFYKDTKLILSSLFIDKS